MTKVKICGLRRSEDAALAVELGAWALGMIMWPASPRYCEPQRAADLADAHRRSAEIAGVFVDQKIDEVVNLTNEIGLSLVQLHGNEGQQYCELIAQRTGARVVKAFRVRDRSVHQEMGKFWDVDFHLLDSYKAGVPGGTGESFDWGFVREPQMLTSRGERVPLILSGGLTPENVAEAIGIVHPFAVDVASGVEREPGVKDEAKMRAFFEAVRGVPVADEPEAEPLTGVNEEVLTLRFFREEAAAKEAERIRAEKSAEKRAFIDRKRREEQAAAEAAAEGGEVGETPEIEVGAEPEGESPAAEIIEGAEIPEPDVEETTETEAAAPEEAPAPETPVESN
jgi:phosphoribosylanthranilate isomerase